MTRSREGDRRQGKEVNWPDLATGQNQGGLQVNKGRKVGRGRGNRGACSNLTEGGGRGRAQGAYGRDRYKELGRMK